MCDRCQRGYHVECLGPFYPTEPEGEDDVWVSFVISWQHLDDSLVFKW